MKILFRTITISIWSFILILFIGAIIVMSLPSNLGNSSATFSNHNGWWIVNHVGLKNIFNKFPKGSAMTWWYDKDVNSSEALCAVMMTVLIILIPIFSIIFGAITIKLYNAYKYPKSIEFIDSIKKFRKVKRATNKQLKKANKHFKNKKIIKRDFLNIENDANEKLKNSRNEYNKFLIIWQASKKRINENKKFIIKFKKTI